MKKKIYDCMMLSQVKSLEIQIPKDLFYYAEGLENGCEHHLENKEIRIDIIGEDTRDNRQILIIIKEGRDTLKELCDKKDSFNIQHINVILSYQKARKLIFDIITVGSPYSVNLITR